MSPAKRNALALLVAAAVIAFFVLRGKDAKVPEPAAKEEQLAPLPPPTAVALTPREKASALAQAPPEDVPDGPPMDCKSFNARKAAMTEQALKTVVDWINYPLWSSPLTENMQYKPAVPVHAEHAGPGPGGFPKLELYMEKVSYLPGEPVRVFAVAHGANGLITFDAITGKTVGGIRPRPEMDLPWAEQADHTYVATLDIPPDIGRKNRGEWGVNIDCQIGGEHRVAHTLFYLQATDATITGPYRAVLENGSLSVYVTIKATLPSRQHLKGELWTAKGEPVAYAWVRNDETPVGPSEMKLVFYGKTIRDAGFDGPYVVKNLLLTTFDDNNDRIENPVVDPGLTTAAFKRDSFTDRPINGDDPTLTEKRKILEDELRKAKRDGYDPAHPEPAPPTRANKNLPAPQ